MKEKLRNLNKLVEGKSPWLEDAQERKSKAPWLKHSQKIALQVLTTLREKGIKQVELASIMGVSPQQINKIVKGRENLTLETISKLEQVLEIQLLTFSGHHQIKKQLDAKAKDEAQLHVYKQVKIATTYASYHSRQASYSQVGINEPSTAYGNA